MINFNFALALLSGIPLISGTLYFIYYLLSRRGRMPDTYRNQNCSHTKKSQSSISGVSEHRRRLPAGTWTRSSLSSCDSNLFSPLQNSSTFHENCSSSDSESSESAVLPKGPSGNKNPSVERTDVPKEWTSYVFTEESESEDYDTIEEQNRLNEDEDCNQRPQRNLKPVITRRRQQRRKTRDRKFCCTLCQRS